jgi:hypothetical protein
MKIPNLKTSDGRRSIGILALVGLLGIRHFIPDLTIDDILNVVNLWVDNNMSLEKLYTWVTDGTLAGILLNELRGKTDASDK